MDNRNARYWNDKAARSVKAKKHLDYVSSKYADNIKVRLQIQFYTMQRIYIGQLRPVLLDSLSWRWIQ